MLNIDPILKFPWHSVYQEEGILDRDPDAEANCTHKFHKDISDQPQIHQDLRKLEFWWMPCVQLQFCLKGFLDRTGEKSFLDRTGDRGVVT